MKREEFCERAKEIITVDRNNQYGEPEDSFQTIAELWSAFVGVTITKEEVAAMMILFKVARLKHQSKADTWIDIAGYSCIGGEISGAEEKKECILSMKQSR